MFLNKPKPIQLLKSEEDYRKYDALSQSAIKPLLKGPFKNRVMDKKSKALRMGWLVDFFLTRLGVDKEMVDLHEEIKILRHKEPSGLMGKQISLMLDGFSFEEAYFKAGHKRDDMKAVHNKVMNSDYYWEALTEDYYYTYSQKEYQTCKRIYNSMKTHEFTEWYCRKSYSDVEAKYQLAIVFEYRGHTCKALLDKCFFNHKEKKILPIDFKTTGFSTLKFKDSFYKFGYDFQAAWYTLALKAMFPKYTILPFEFVVESTAYQGTPLVWQTNKKLLKGTKKKIDRSIDLFEWYKDNGSRYRKDVALRKGKMLL